MPRELLSMQSGAWQEVSGTDITIENCLRSRVRDLRVEGKTYQNLLNPINVNKWNINSGTIEDNYAKLIQNGFKESLTTRALIKQNTKYTLCYNVINSTLTNESFCLIGASSVPWILDNNTSLPKSNGFHKKLITSSNKSDVSLLSFGISSGSDDGEYIELSDIMLLEGDHTNTELPNSIEGIESVGEKENNILSVKINDNVTTINLPIPLRSLPNGVRDTVKGNKMIQRIGKIVIDGTNNISITTVRENTIRLLLIDSTIKNVSSESSLPFLSDSLLKTASCWSNDVEGVFQGNNGNKFVISILKSKLSGNTIEAVKSYFTANPMTIYYELETPIVHDLTIPSIYTEKGTNIITTENNIKPNLNAKVKVKK